MGQSHRRFSEEFKRQTVERMTAAPDEISILARELGISRSRLYEWRKQYPAPLASPPYGACRSGEGPGEGSQFGPGVRAEPPAVRAALLPLAGTERGLGGEVGTSGLGGEVGTSGPGGEVGTSGMGSRDVERLHQSLLDTAFTLTHAIQETTGSAPLNQLSAALGLVIDRLLKLEAARPSAPAGPNEEVFRIAYIYPDGTEHSTPPWAEGDPAYEKTISRGVVWSPFWEDGSREVDDPGDGAEGG